MVGQLREWIRIQAAPSFLWGQVCFVVSSEWSTRPRKKWFLLSFIGPDVCEMRVSPGYLRLCTRPVKEQK